MATKKMMLIEDEDDLRTLLEEYLKDNGLSVASFGSADKALPYWENNSSDIDLVLTDMRMPGTIDGIGFARAERAKGAHQPSIVMISGFEPPPRQMLQDLGITEFISKPFRISELSRLCANKLSTKA
ncbi:MAG: response regulator [Deltaproteobacteria bacterium]|nr:response regulator [Deltaproteobacteria bacterium]